MKLRFQVLGSGHSSFHSSKTNRDYQRARLMGFVEDCEGTSIPATADMSFDATLSDLPKSGSSVILDVTEMSTKSSMCELTFASLQIVKTGSK